MTCVEALAGQVAVLKPQSAFFERHGSAGVAVLERVVREARAAGALVITDAKRGDIGSTMTAYAQAYLDQSQPAGHRRADGEPLPGLRVAASGARTGCGTTGRAVRAGLTSNPDGAAGAARPDRRRTVRWQRPSWPGWRPTTRDSNDLGDVGLVVGATVGSAVADLGIDLAASHAPLLAPGIGAQGAGAGRAGAGVRRGACATCCRRRRARCSAPDRR